jgi:hypothetical protein
LLTVIFAKVFYKQLKAASQSSACRQENVHKKIRTKFDLMIEQELTPNSVRVYVRHISAEYDLCK